ncbi:hypothetical protein AURDEDRAFT_169304 [Auricularia subglabra TFB-10046 SS5]|nr:hypothetical protein AURDEDRAFT_169304 [Auricularia subglabra TFB-10046 SS5]
MIDAAGESSEAITMPPRAPPGNFGGDIEQPSRPVMLQRHADFVPAHTDAQWVCGSPCLAVHGDRSSHAIHAAIPMRSPLTGCCRYGSLARSDELRIFADA